MKFSISPLVAIAVAVPTIASAQVIGPGSAGAPGLTSPAGISVVGRGVVRVHADEVRFSATLFPTNGRSPVTADVDAAADAIVKALRDGGVSDATNAFAGSYNTNGPPRHHGLRAQADA